MLWAFRENGLQKRTLTGKHKLMMFRYFQLSHFFQKEKAPPPPPPKKNNNNNNNKHHCQHARFDTSSSASATGKSLEIYIVTPSYNNTQNSEILVKTFFLSVNGPFAASGHMVHAEGQAAHWDIQNKENSNLS